MVEREAVRLGTKFQVANKWCSFVAVEAKTKDEAIATQKEKDQQSEGTKNFETPKIGRSGTAHRHSPNPPPPYAAHTRGFPQARCAVVSPDPSGDLIDYSDEDVGFGLFGDDVGTGSEAKPSTRGSAAFTSPFDLNML